MADAIAEFFIGLGVQVDEKAMEKAEDAVKDLGKTLSVGLAAGLAAVASAATAVVGGLFVLTSSVSKATRSAATMGARIGITSEQMQELGYAMETTGGAVEDIADGLKDLGLKAFEAATNGASGAADAFRKLGVRVRDSSGQIKDRMTLFEDVARGMSKIEDATQRAALANQLFGGASLKMLPLLAKGEEGIAALRQEARDLGLVVDAEAAAAMVEFDLATARLRRSLDGFKTQVAVQLLPAFKGIVDRTLEWVTINRTLIQQRIDQTIRKGGEAVQWVRDRWRELDTLVRERVGGWETVFRAVAAAFATAGIVLGFVKLRAAIVVIAPMFKALIAVGAAVVAKFIAIAAAVTFLFLAIEDLITGLQGGESYTRDFIDAWDGTDTVFGKIIDWFRALLAIGKQLWDFLAVALPTAFDALWTIVGPVLTLIWDALKALGNLLLGQFGDALDESMTKFGKIGAVLQVMTLRLAGMRKSIDDWAKTWRGRVEQVTDLVRTLAEWIGKLPLDKLASAASFMARNGNPIGLLGRVGRAAVSHAATSFAFGDTNVNVAVRTGASPDEIAAANAAAVANVQRRNLALAYARHEGGPR